jgi:hypothetical protein
VPSPSLDLLTGGVALWLGAGIIVTLIFATVGLLAGIAISARSNPGTAAALQRRDGPTQIRPSAQAFEPVSLHFIVDERPAETLTVPSGRGASEADQYLLDLGQATCSCEGWKKRERYPEADPRRLCRHLVIALRQRQLIQGTDKWSNAIISNGEGVPLNAWVVRLETAPDVLIALGDNEEWLNVFAQEQLSGERIADASGPVKRRGWSLLESRWAYGDRVPGARELRKLLQDATVT